MRGSAESDRCRQPRGEHDRAGDIHLGTVAGGEEVRGSPASWLASAVAVGVVIWRSVNCEGPKAAKKTDDGGGGEELKKRKGAKGETAVA